MIKNTFFFEKLIIYFFSLLPISFILGNALTNFNIIVIDLSFLIICFYQKKWSWLKNKYFICLFIIWVYLTANSFFTNISEDTISLLANFSKTDSQIRSITFIRFIILVFAVEHFFLNKQKTINKVFYFWFILISIFIFDVFFEKIFGSNILGFKSPNSERIVSFFKDESVAGGYLLGVSIITASFLFKNFNKIPKEKLLSNFFFIICIICICVSNERSNFIKSIIIFSIFILFVNSNYLIFKKINIILILIIGIILSGVIFKDVYNNHTAVFKRLGIWDKIFIPNNNKSTATKEISENKKLANKKDQSLTDVLFNNERNVGIKRIVYFAHYSSAWKIFKDYPIFGVGTKNFRHVCYDPKYANAELVDQRCLTHPHQIHFELLSEIGVVGYFIVIFFIIYTLKNSFQIYFKHKDITVLMLSSFILAHMLPILPSGSFFSTFNASLFWLNFSILHAFLKKK